MTSLRLRTIERSQGKTNESGGLPVDEDDAFLDDTASSDDDRAGNGENSRLGMNYGPCADSDVALEFDILADNGFRVDGELVAATTV